MRSRIFALVLSVLIFLSALFIVGFPENGKAITEQEVETTASSDAATETTATGEAQQGGTVMCSFKDISYGSDPKQTFDLNLPVDNRKETGLVLFIHGGGWVGGDKSSITRTFTVHQANELYATASINYRCASLGKTDMYNIIDDITAALSHIRTMAAGYSVNINKVVLSGFSAGGHLALLYAYRYKEISPIEIVGVIASSSVPDLTVDSFYENNALGNAEYMCEMMSKACGVSFTKETRLAHNTLLAELSPVSYVSADTLPTILIHGKKDTVAPYEGSVRLSEKLKKYSVDHEFITFENSGHNLAGDQLSKNYAEILLLGSISEWLGATEN